MTALDPNHPILELRVALTTGDYERLVKFYTTASALNRLNYGIMDKARP
jgi:hypothetical protein